MLGVTLESFWENFCIILESFRDKFWVIHGPVYFFVGKVEKTYGANPIFLELGTFTHLVFQSGEGGEFFNLP